MADVHVEDSHRFDMDEPFRAFRGLVNATLFAAVIYALAVGVFLVVHSFRNQVRAVPGVARIECSRNLDTDIRRYRCQEE